MLVLRLTTGDGSRDVEVATLPCLLGASPTAGLSLQQVGWANAEGTLEMKGDSLTFTPSQGRPSRSARTIEYGVPFFVGTVQIVVSPQSANTPSHVMFGTYDDEASPASTEEPTFQLAAEPPPPPSSLQHASSHAGTSLARSGAVSPTAPPSSKTTSVAHDTSTRQDAQPQQDAKAVMGFGQRFGQRVFHRELVEQLKKTPFFVLSAAVHAVVLLLLAMLMEKSAEQTEAGVGMVRGTMSESEDVGGETLEPEDTFDPPSEQLIEQLEHAQEMPDPFEEAPPPPSASATDELLPESNDAEIPPANIGLHPSIRAARRRVRPRKKPSKKAPSATTKALNTPYGTGKASDVNRRSAQLVRDAIGGRSKGDGAALDRVKREDILVVDGSFDSIERVLDALRVPYTFASPYRLLGKNALSLSSFQIVFWNCGEALLPRDRAPIIRMLQRFVSGGGYLFTTDWGIANIIHYAFPGYLRTRGEGSGLGGELVVNIEAAPGKRNHPLLKGVFLEGTQGRWWLEQKSYDMRPGSGRKVEILIEAPELRSVHGANSAVAATFPYGRGRVLHATGHYYQKAGNLAGTIASHRLALNFILMRFARHR